MAVLEMMRTINIALGWNRIHFIAEGTTIYLTSERARSVAMELIRIADLIDAGHAYAKLDAKGRPANVGKVW